MKPFTPVSIEEQKKIYCKNLQRWYNRSLNHLDITFDFEFEKCNELHQKIRLLHLQIEVKERKIANTADKKI